MLFRLLRLRQHNTIWNISEGRVMSRWLPVYQIAAFRHTPENSTTTTTGPHPRQSFTNSHLLTRVRYDVMLCVTLNTFKSLEGNGTGKKCYRLSNSSATYPALRGYA